MTFEPEPEDRTEIRINTPRSPRYIFGAILVVLGTGILVEQVTGVDLSFIPLLIGVGLLVAWSQSRRSGLLIAGCVVTGVGAGHVFGDMVIPELAQSVELLSIAGGFASIHLLSRRKPSWPLAVAGILTVIATAQLADLSRVISPSIARVGLPVVIVIGGIVLLIKDRMSRQASFVAIAVLIILALVFASARDVEPMSRFAPFPGQMSFPM